MTPREKLTMYVGGQVYGGWTSIRIRHGIEQIAGTFQIGLTDRWPGQITKWTIPPGELCELKIGEHTVISGYVDSVSVDYDKESHELSISGRDRTGDLVDCSAPSKSFSGLTFLQIAQILCEPYKVKVYDETNSVKKVTATQKKIGKQGTPPPKLRAAGALPKAGCQNGESVFKFLERIARSEGVLLVSDHEGGLLITTAGRAPRCPVTLEHGVNILSAKSDRSHTNLFSEITVKGQSSGQGIGADGLESIFSSKATVSRGSGGAVVRTGSQIGRYRPLIIVSESQADAKRIKQRAEWEVGNREAKSVRYTVKVQGWYPKWNDGDIWRINSMVKVVDPECRMDGEWLIAAVNFSLDASGTIAELELTSPKAFDQLPEIPTPDGGAGEGGRKMERI